MGSCCGPFYWRPFKDNVGFVTDGAPDADAVDILTDIGATETIVPPLEHRLTAARATKQKDARPARNIDLTFVHRKGASFAKRGFDTTAHTRLRRLRGAAPSFAYRPSALPRAPPLRGRSSTRVLLAAIPRLDPTLAVIKHGGDPAWANRDGRAKRGTWSPLLAQHPNARRVRVFTPRRAERS